MAETPSLIARAGRLFGSIAVAAAALLGATAASAQVGGITVVVTDQDGQPLSGATVTLSHALGYVKTTAGMTNSLGGMDFPVLRPAPGYAIEVSVPGMSRIRRDDIRVRINESQTVSVQMVEELAEQVRVTANYEVVDLDRSQTSTKFTDQFILDLPVLDRFYQNVLTMAPGVQDADGDGNPNVHGSRARDFQALVSGVSNVDPLTGQWLSRVSPNSIEEMEVITAGAGVEFGRAQGGFARIIQKQGSNEHEGVVEYYWQSSKLDGEGDDNSTIRESPSFDTYQPGFQFSGPIIKDRLWYRVSYERRDRTEPINVISDIEVFGVDSETRDAQLTWQVSPRNKLALQYNSDPVRMTNFGISSIVPASASEIRDRDVSTWKLHWTAPYSPRILVETTVAWQDVNLVTSPTAPDSLNSCAPEADETFINTARCTNLMTGLTSGPYDRTEGDHRQRFTVKGQATVYAGRFLGANHQFKLGLNIENERYFRDLTRGSSITYEEISEGVDGPGTVHSFIPFGVILARLAVPRQDDSTATGTNWAVYAEDQLKPTSNVVLTLGARVDREEIDSEGRKPFDPVGELETWESHLDSGGSGSQFDQFFTGYEAFGAFKAQLQQLLCEGVAADTIGNCHITVSEAILGQFQEALQSRRVANGIRIANTNVSPYLSVAWSPWQNGKTVFKAAAGRHYNNIPLIVPLQELEPVLADVEYRRNLQTGETARESLISPRISVTTVDDNLQTPYQDELTLSYERELWPETSLQLTYISRRFRDQIQDTNLNQAPGDYGRCRKEQISFRPVQPSPGTGMVLDEYSGLLYEDTDPGIGDGLLDDCAGFQEFTNIGLNENNTFGFGQVINQRPDGFTDLYIQNPFWGDVFFISNLNEIDYEAYVLEVVRRRYRSWEMSASYTYSETTGDGEDFFQELGNDPSLRASTFGYQSYDQRHVVKLNATTVTPWGIRLGTAISWQSGLPYTILFQAPSQDALPPTTASFSGEDSQLRQIYPSHLRNDQRNTSYWNVDLRVTKEWSLTRGLNLQVSADVFNVFDDETYQIYNPFLEMGQQINGINEAQRRFGRRWQLGARLAF